MRDEELAQARADLERYEETVVGDLNETVTRLDREVARLKGLVAASEAPGHAVRMAATVPDLTRRAEQAEALLRDLVDPDPCVHDHHGHCQAHGWTVTEPRCADARAREHLAAVDGAQPGEETP